MILGKTRRGATAHELAADATRTSRFVLAEAARAPKLTALLDGLGSGSGDALVKGVVYDGAGGLVAASGEVVVADGAAAAWVDLRFALAGGVALAAGTYDLGVIAGGATLTARVFGDATVAADGRTAADAYSDGPALTLPSPTPLSEDTTLFASAFVDYAPRDSVDAFELARLPFGEGQARLAQAGRDGAPILTTLGWHGTSIDPRTLDASFAVVLEGGALEGLVGRRVRITPRTGSSRAPLYAYVVASDPDLPDPITVTRRAFWQFALPSADDVPVLVEALA
jgi:hypothetical protein